MNPFLFCLFVFHTRLGVNALALIYESFHTRLSVHMNPFIRNLNNTDHKQLVIRQPLTGHKQLVISQPLTGHPQTCHEKPESVVRIAARLVVSKPLNFVNLLFDQRCHTLCAEQTDVSQVIIKSADRGRVMGVHFTSHKNRLSLIEGVCPNSSNWSVY